MAGFDRSEGFPTQDALLDEDADPGPQQSEPEARYEVGDEIASGGLGRVLQAWDHRLERPVALKVLRGVASSAGRARFARETRITARLEHPAVVPVHDAGTSEDGKPFLVMKRIEGQTLEAAVLARRGLAERLGLLSHVIDACHALAYAHSRGIVHRDVKPENVLVGAFGETVVIDWGLAKRLDTDDEDDPEEAAPPWGEAARSSLTRVGAIVGTPAFMAPEQASAGAIDRRTDVYALGALLYYCLAGQAPYGGALADRTIEAVRAGPPTPLEQVVPNVPRDLCAILGKAMARDPAARYPDAQVLAADLERFRTGQLVQAYAYGPLERVRRAIRQQPAAASLLAALALVVALAFAAVVDQRNQALQARSAEEAARVREQRRADEVTLEQARMALEAAPQRTLQLLARISDPHFRPEVARTLAADALSRPLPRVLEGHDGQLMVTEFSPDGTRLVTAGDRGVGRLWDLTRPGESTSLPCSEVAIWQILFSPDGSRLAIAAGEEVTLWDGRDGTRLGVLPSQDVLVQMSAFSPDGARIATVAVDGVLRIWTAEGHLLHTLRAHDHGFDVSWTPAGDGVLTTGRDGRAVLWDADTWTPRWEVQVDYELYFATPSPDGRHVALYGNAPPLVIVDLDDGRERLRGAFQGWGQTGAFSPDGRWFYLGSSDGLVRGFSLEGAPQRVLDAAGVPSALAVAGDVVLVGSDGRRALLWEPETGQRTRLAGVDGLVRDVALTEDGARAAAVGSGREALLWDLRTRGPRTLEGHTAAIRTVQGAPGGRLLTAAADGARIWSVDTGKSIPIDVGAGGASDTALLADGATVLVLGQGGVLVRTDLLGTAPQPLATVEAPAVLLEAHPTRPWVVAGSRTGAVQILDGHSGEALLSADLQTRLSRTRFSPDGARLAIAGQGVVAVWALDDLDAPPLRVDLPELMVSGLDWYRGRVVTSSFDHRVRWWEADLSGSVPMEPHLVQPTYVRAGSSGWLFAGDTTGQVLGWSPEGTPVPMVGHTQYVGHFDVSSDGRMLASAAWDATVWLWALDTDPVVGRRLAGHVGNVPEVAFLPGDDRIASVGADGLVRVWEDGLSHDPLELRAQILELAAHVDAGTVPELR